MAKKKMILVMEVTAREQNVSAFCNFVNGTLTTLENISKNEVVSMKLQSFCNKMTKNEMILAMEVTARKRSES